MSESKSEKKKSSRSEIKRIPENLRNLFYDLQLIAQLRAGDKVCLNDRSIVKSNSYIGSIKRTICSENKEKLLNFIDILIMNATLCLEQYKNSVYHRIIIENLKDAKRGMESLLKTYEDKHDFISRLIVFINDIDLLQSS